MVLTFKQAKDLLDLAKVQGGIEEQREMSFWLFEAALEDKKANVDLSLLKDAIADACRFNVVAISERGTPEEVYEMAKRAQNTTHFLATCVGIMIPKEEREELGDWINTVFDEAADIEIENSPEFLAEIARLGALGEP